MTACPKCGYDADAKVIARWTFTVERDTPSLNDRVYNAATYRGSMYRKVRDAWCWEFRAARLKVRIPRARTRRRVTIVRNYGGRARERDRDNLIGGAKAVIDAMVSEGLLVDDTSLGAEIHYDQRRIIPPLKGVPPVYITIEIEELTAS